MTLKFLIPLLIISSSANSQSTLEINSSKLICNCLDSLSHKIQSVDKIFPKCFTLAVEKFKPNIIDESLKLYGDTSLKTIDKYFDVLLGRVSVELVKSCQTFYIYTDSSRYVPYKNLNTDSLNFVLAEFEKTELPKRNITYYENKALLSFKLKLYDNALESIEKGISIDSTNLRIVFLKAWIEEIKGNFQEAIILYDKVARLTNNYTFYMFSEIAKKKKNGL